MALVKIIERGKLERVHFIATNSHLAAQVVETFL
jgi:hypothetical protein